MKGRIAGTGAFNPQSISDDFYIELFGKKARAISKILPHHNRYCAIDLNTGDIYTTNIEMAYEASLMAIKNANLSPKDIDMIIYSTATPDYVVPPCFALLQEKLGISKCMGFDIRSGCAGFGTAVNLALNLIKSLMVQRVLVVGSDLLSSRFSEFLKDKSSITLKTLFNLMFFGDGAGAVVLENTDESNSSGFFYYDMESNMANVPYGSIIEIGGSRYPYPINEIPRERWPIFQANGLSDEYLPKVLIYALQKFKDKTSIGISDFDYYLMPVVSEKMQQEILTVFPDMDLNKIVSISAKGGALLNAAIPIALSNAISKNSFKSGDMVLLYAAENTKWQYALSAFIW
ncbi:MAG: 3-oxoacyl-ACP synthase III family protein [Thermoanaerobacteraceae bacterium]|nr:3-oxoacyl-ACP synthase III family protein [Thermoanaerobacteraceae bacterium]